MKKNTFLLSAVLLLFFACSKTEDDSLALPEESTVQSGFSLRDFDDDLVKENLKIDWNSYVTKADESGAEIREYPGELTQHGSQPR